MQTTQSAQFELREHSPGFDPPGDIDRLEHLHGLTIEAPRHEHDARREIEALRDEIEQLVRGGGRERARDVVESALESVTLLQIVTANLDACNPTKNPHVGPAVVSLADARLRGSADAIERGMTYTADNQMRLLQNP